MIRHNTPATILHTHRLRRLLGGLWPAMRTAAQVAPDDDLASIRARLTQLESRLPKAQALRDWAKDAKPAAKHSAVLPPDRPPTEEYGIYPKMYYPRFHYPNPVTLFPVQYPPGITAAVEETTSKQGSSSPPKNVKEFTARLNELEGQIHLSIAYDAVENLVSAHGYDLDEARESSAIHQTFHR